MALIVLLFYLNLLRLWQSFILRWWVAFLILLVVMFVVTLVDQSARAAAIVGVTSIFMSSVNIVAGMISSHIVSGVAVTRFALTCAIATSILINLGRLMEGRHRLLSRFLGLHHSGSWSMMHLLRLSLFKRFTSSLCELHSSCMLIINMKIFIHFRGTHRLLWFIGILYNFLMLNYWLVRLFFNMLFCNFMMSLYNRTFNWGRIPPFVFCHFFLQSLIFSFLLSDFLFHCLDSLHRFLLPRWATFRCETGISAFNRYWSSTWIMITKFIIWVFPSLVGWTCPHSLRTSECVLSLLGLILYFEASLYLWFDFVVSLWAGSNVVHFLSPESNLLNRLLYNMSLLKVLNVLLCNIISFS